MSFMAWSAYEREKKPTLRPSTSRNTDPVCEDIREVRGMLLKRIADLELLDA